MMTYIVCVGLPELIGELPVTHKPMPTYLEYQDGLYMYVGETYATSNHEGKEHE